MIKNISIGRFFPGESLIHKLDPRLKLYFIFLFILSIFFIKSFLVFIPITILIFSIMKIAKLPFLMVLKGLKGIFYIVIATVILNLVLTPGEVLFRFWIITVTVEGLKLSIFMSVRIILLVIGTSLLTLTTSPIVLTDALEYVMKPLEKIKFPSHSVAMMMTIALRFIPTILEEMDKIMKAQTSRGADFESGNIIERAKGLIPLLVPLFVNALKRADELAIAMEARCYRGGNGRTRMNVLKYDKKDYITMIFITIFFALVIASRYFVNIPVSYTHLTLPTTPYV